jgi:hypothetical protein
MNVLVVDVGGTTVKILVIGQDEPRRFPSGPTLTAEQMVVGVKKLAGDWKYIDRLSRAGHQKSTACGPALPRTRVDGL